MQCHGWLFVLKGVCWELIRSLLWPWEASLFIFSSLNWTLSCHIESHLSTKHVMYVQYAQLLGLYWNHFCGLFPLTFFSRNLSTQNIKTKKKRKIAVDHISMKFEDIHMYVKHLHKHWICHFNIWRRKLFFSGIFQDVGEKSRFHLSLSLFLPPLTLFLVHDGRMGDSCQWLRSLSTAEKIRMKSKQL